MINIRFIPRIAYAGQGGFDWQWTPAEIPTDHVPILYENVDPTTIKQPKFHRDHGGQYAPIRQNSRHQFNKTSIDLCDETKGFGRTARENPQQPIRNKICDFQTKWTQIKSDE